uniref:HTH CENPB-type domain-containing protein n=1 Tax=Chrysemys picta bellii TaxID=8478 RepID=A0A8C3FL07_CHRPI
MDTPVRKRKSFSAQEKLYALDQLKKGKQQTQLARDLGIRESTLRGWKKEEKLRSLPCILEEETGLQRKKVKFANDESLDSALYQWFVQARSEEVPISGPILKAQAEKFDHLINGNESKFKSSNVWLDTISQVLLSGEIRSADKEAANSNPIELKKLLEESCYTADQVYNCDETDLCSKMLPNRTFAIRTDGHKREGFKQRKDRVTLLFCVNKSGSHKVRPLMIRKARSPRCFHHVNMKALPFEYTNSKNAWIIAPYLKTGSIKLSCQPFGLICENSSRRKKLSSCWIIALPTPQRKILSVVTARLKSLISRRTLLQKSSHWTKASDRYLSKTIVAK